MSRISRPYVKKYPVRYSRSRSNAHPTHLKICRTKYTQLTYQVSKTLDPKIDASKHQSYVSRQSSSRQ